MIKQLLSILKRADEDRATAEDYEALFSTPEGQRVLTDLAIRYRVGRPSFAFDKLGRVNTKASARSDAAKVIICDLIDRGKLKSQEAQKPTKAKASKKISQLPQSANTI